MLFIVKMLTECLDFISLNITILINANRSIQTRCIKMLPILIKECLLSTIVRVTPRTSNRPTPSRGTPSSGSSRSIISAATLKHHGRTKVNVSIVHVH